MSRNGLFFSYIFYLLLMIRTPALMGQDLNSYNMLQLNLNKALELATKNYPAIKARESDKQGALRNVKSAQSEFLPALMLQDQYSYASANGLVGTFYPNEGYALPTSGGVRGDNIYNGSFGSYTTLAVNWPVFAFGKIRSNVNLAKAEKNQANAEYENQIFQQQVKVIDTYLLLLTYEKLVTVQQENLKRAQILQRTIAAAANSGMRPGVDSSFANAEVSRTKILLLQSRSNERSARIDLGELIGSENDSIVIDSMIFYSHTPVLLDSANIILENNPLLRVYQSRVDVGSKKALSVMKSYFPSLRVLAAGIGRGSGISNTTDYYSQNLWTGVQYKTYNYLVGVSFLWNIMDYPRIRNASQREASFATAKQYEYDEQKLKIKRELENANIQLTLSKEQVKEAPIQLTAARNAFSQVQSRYQSGLSTLPEVAQNFFILNRAEVDLTVAYNNVWRALLLKAAATGDLSLFTNEVK
ncbi:MAG: outer rane efflux protein [Chitinophagaceae bacterium]|nr:outer rane efflux protein [Chitinophagaceae bacterium]